MEGEEGRYNTECSTSKEKKGGKRGSVGGGCKLLFWIADISFFPVIAIWKLRTRSYLAFDSSWVGKRSVYQVEKNGLSVCILIFKIYSVARGLKCFFKTSSG